MEREIAAKNASRFASYGSEVSLDLFIRFSSTSTDCGRGVLIHIERFALTLCSCLLAVASGSSHTQVGRRQVGTISGVP